jgi:hypothetical protein
MHALVDALRVDASCSVLEIGFGLGMSADRIQSYGPASHTIVECSDEVLVRARLWAEGKPGVRIVAGTWQATLPQLGAFDRVFFDDYPLDEVPSERVSAAPLPSPWSRWHAFLDEAVYHMEVGGVATGYLARSDVPLERGDCTVTVTSFAVCAAPHCTYFTAPVAFIPLITLRRAPTPADAYALRLALPPPSAAQAGRQRTRLEEALLRTSVVRDAMREMRDGAIASGGGGDGDGDGGGDGAVSQWLLQSSASFEAPMADIGAVELGDDTCLARAGMGLQLARLLPCESATGGGAGAGAGAGADVVEGDGGSAAALSLGGGSALDVAASRRRLLMRFQQLATSSDQRGRDDGT